MPLLATFTDSRNPENFREFHMGIYGNTIVSNIPYPALSVVKQQITEPGEHEISVNGSKIYASVKEIKEELFNTL